MRFTIKVEGVDVPGLGSSVSLMFDIACLRGR